MIRLLCSVVLLFPLAGTEVARAETAGPSAPERAETEATDPGGRAEASQGGDRTSGIAEEANRGGDRHAWRDPGAKPRVLWYFI